MTPDGRTKAIDWTDIDKVTNAHYARLRTIERLYDTGMIDFSEFTRREQAEERRYDKEMADLS